MKTTLCVKYNQKNKGIAEIIDQLKQRATVIAEKIKQYENQIIHFQQNSQFRANQHQFFKILVNGKDYQTKSDKPKALQFWTSLWENNR